MLAPNYTGVPMRKSRGKSFPKPRGKAIPTSPGTPLEPFRVQGRDEGASRMRTMRAAVTQGPQTERAGAWVPCPNCLKVYPSCDVETTAPYPDRRGTGCLVQRRLVCRRTFNGGSCGHESVWTQRCTASGELLIAISGDVLIKSISAATSPRDNTTQAAGAAATRSGNGQHRMERESCSSK